MIGYLRLSGLPVPSHVERAAHRFRYNKLVFVAPPWPAIFTQDAERMQTVDEAEATHRAMVDVYSDLGYELLPLPFAPVSARLEFVRKRMGQRY